MFLLSFFVVVVLVVLVVVALLLFFLFFILSRHSLSFLLCFPFLQKVMNSNGRFLSFLFSPSSRLYDFNRSSESLWLHPLLTQLQQQHYRQMMKMGSRAVSPGAYNLLELWAVEKSNLFSVLRCRRLPALSKVAVQSITFVSHLQKEQGE